MTDLDAVTHPGLSFSERHGRDSVITDNVHFELAFLAAFPVKATAKQKRAAYFQPEEIAIGLSAK